MIVVEIASEDQIIAPALPIGLLAAGQERVLSILTGGALVANFMCNLLLVSIVGFTEAAVALAISELVLVIGLLWAVSKTIRLESASKESNAFCYACNRSILRIVISSSVIVSEGYWWNSVNITGVIDSLGIAVSTIHEERIGTNWH